MSEPQNDPLELHAEEIELTRREVAALERIADTLGIIACIGLILVCLITFVAVKL